MFIPSVIFQDSSSFVRRLFLDKTHKLLKEHVIPIRYACAFTLATSDSLKDLQHDVCFCFFPHISCRSNLYYLLFTNAYQLICPCSHSNIWWNLSRNTVEKLEYAKHPCCREGQLWISQHT